MTDDDLADALSSDFTCSAVPSAGDKKAPPEEVTDLLFKKECLLA